MSQIVYPVKFNNVDLSTVTGLTVLSTNPYAPPKRKVSVDNLVRTSQGKVSTGFYTEKDITVKVGITRNNRADIEQSLDTLMGYVQGLEKDLLVPQAGTIRRYVCTFADAVVQRGGTSYLELDLIFTCSDRFGYDLQYIKLLDTTGRTLYNYTDSFTFEGTADTQAPVITAYLSALSGASTNEVAIINATTGRGITVSRAWTAGDRLILDVQNRTVTINGVAADFTGAFPEFAPGVGYMNYQDDFATRTLALSVYYNKRYV